MYNMLIVDDEITAVNGLAYGNDWSKININEIYKAYNGIEALTFLSNNKIDIVITDIRMPELDGLKLANSIKEKWPFAKVILISGYDEFDYAQKAIDFGVFKYLTKPVSVEDIRKTVEKAIIQINKELEQTQLIETAQKQLENFLPIVKKRLIRELLTKGRTDMLSKTSLLNIKSDDHFLLLLIQISDWNKNIPFKTKEIYKLAIQNSIRQMLLKQFPCTILNDEENQLIIFIHNNDLSQLNSLKKYIEKMAEMFLHSIKRSLNCTLSVFWSRIVNMELLSIEYKNLANLQKHHLYNKDGIIISYEQSIKNQKYPFIYSLNKYPSFSTLINTFNLEICKKRIEDIFTELESLDNISNDLILQVFHYISYTLIETSNKNNISISDWIGSDINSLYCFNNIKSLNQFKNFCFSIVEKFLNHINKYNNNKNSQIIKRAKQILLNNINHEFSLNDIASQLFIHPNYLSKLFKEEEGITIIQYITNLRIEKAKKLLINSHLKIYEIAEKTGYNTIAHFNRTFKREVGMSPKEFKEKH